MASDDPTARRRRIAKKGSDRLAMITGGRAPNLHSPPSDTSTAQPHHSHTESYPSSLTHHPDQLLPSDENQDLPSKPKTQSNSSKQSSPRNHPKSDLEIYLHKTVSPSQLRPAILATQDTRRKCSFFVGIIALLSYIGFPILGSYVIKSIILSRPLLLLLVFNVVITVGPLVMDAMRMIQHESRVGYSSGEGEIGEHFGTPFEWGMLFKTGFCALFMDSCIYSVVVVCGTLIFQKCGL
ncbi:hypothetical protein Lser_V15G29846 [Lactuca serriola]